MAVLVAVTQEVGAGAVPIAALELAQAAVPAGAGGGLIRAVSAVPLAVTLPPDRDAPGGEGWGEGEAERGRWR